MEAPLESEAAAVASAGADGLVGGEFKASEEAIEFLSSIEPAELQRCVFSDSLVTVSEGGQELGKFALTVEFARRIQRPCLLLHGHSQGAIDNNPCGTAVTAYLSSDLEVLEQDHHEYLKLEGHTLDRRCHMVRRDEEMVIDKVTTTGEVRGKNCVSYHLSAVRGLVTEGSNLLLMRLMALRKKVPENMTFISLDQELHIIHTTYTEVGPTQLEVGGETVEVFGIERRVDSVKDVSATWHCYFLPDGHLASRGQVGSPVIMRLLQLPSQLENDPLKDKPVFEKRPLVWEEDMQMHSKFLDRKEELKADYASYMRQHPELRVLLADFLHFLLLRKPDDIFRFAREYFLPFASRRPPETSLKTSPL
uniref:Ciliogenesis-associated TTC17-interacting protein n=1 Tax=Myripristis murdjan TaxID=586833 RepID=A0A667YER8_9TELE